MPQAHAERFAALGRRTQARLDRGEAPDAGHVENVVEALVGKHADDLAVPFEVLVWRHGR